MNNLIIENNQQIQVENKLNIDDIIKEKFKSDKLNMKKHLKIDPIIKNVKYMYLFKKH